ncbi:MAG: 2-oxo acid dehydrogenase subunit E2, partial [Actinobacteria bacterium]|nr:2-oxo acid dehydrogenase subunit E2 [Actinomycetota bacterium]
MEAWADGEVGGDAGGGGLRALPAAPAGSGDEVEPSGAGGGRGGAVYSPVVARMAAEHGIDLAGIRGTGRDGRVRKQDVMAAIEAGAAGPGVDAEPSASPRAGEGEPEVRVTEPGTSVGEPEVGVTEPGTSVGEPLSRMRRAIAEHMTRSVRTAATCTTIIEVDFSGVEAARAGAGLSPLAYVARCVAESLGVFGRLNATLEADVLTRYADVDLGVAVSLGDRGLIVPVVRRAQDRSVEELGAAIRELARRARADDLGPDEVRGATFTITNPGRWGTIGATPIINQPQVGILDMEAIVRRPVVVGGDGIGIRPMGNLCLSWDHRALDGVMAA